MSYLSKIDYNDIVSDTIADYLVKRLQRVQLAAAKLSSWSSRYSINLCANGKGLERVSKLRLAAASFVLRRYAAKLDLLY